MKKQLKKLGFRLKAKLFLTVILPGVIALLAVETARTFLRIRLRDAASKAEPEEAPGESAESGAEPEPVSLEMSPPDFITPRPVKGEVVWRSGR